MTLVSCHHVRWYGTPLWSEQILVVHFQSLPHSWPHLELTLNNTLNPEPLLPKGQPLHKEFQLIL